MSGGNYPKRRDSKHRVLRTGESIRKDGKNTFRLPRQYLQKSDGGICNEKTC